MRQPTTTTPPRPARALIALAAAFLILHSTFFISRAAAQQRAHITILTTTDIHGHMLPTDYYTGKPDPASGLVKAATLIKRARKDAPRLILIDTGDALQGTAFTYYQARVNNQLPPADPLYPDPMIRAMNTLGYDAMTLGNHEFDYGLDTLAKAQTEAHFPFLSANTTHAATGEPAYTPYTIKEIDGVRVAILGITTPSIPTWVDKTAIPGLEYLNPVETAKKYVPLLREKEHADIILVALHAGLGYNLDTGRLTPEQSPHENSAIDIAQQVPGIDAIFAAHTHDTIPSLLVNNTLITQAGRWANALNRADIYLEKPPTPDARWRVTARAATTLPIDATVPPDPEIQALAAPYAKQVDAYLNKVIATSPRELTATDSRRRATPIIDIIQRAQLDAARADISFCSSYALTPRIPAGPVTVRDIVALYSTYDNTLLAVELTGAQVKAALEHSALYYRVTPAPDGKPTITVNPAIRDFNYDMAAGVTYELDPSRPPGDRIQNLRYQNNPIDPAQKFRVAISNYRNNGGGHYPMFENAPILWRSKQEIREILVDWVARQKEIPADTISDWRLIGE